MSRNPAHVICLKLGAEVRKRETFSRGKWEKKALLCPTLHEHHSAEWKIKKRTCSIFEWSSTIILLSHTHDHIPVVFACLEFGMSTPETCVASSTAAFVFELQLSGTKQLRCEKQTCEILTRTGFIINFDCISYQLTVGNIAQHLHTTSLIIHGDSCIW